MAKCEVFGFESDQCGVYCAIRGCTLDKDQKPPAEKFKRRLRPSYVDEALQDLKSNSKTSEEGPQTT
jgi:hypothetical protein